MPAQFRRQDSYSTPDLVGTFFTSGAVSALCDVEEGGIRDKADDSRLAVFPGNRSLFVVGSRALSLSQPIKINATVVIRYVDLTSINHRRIKLVEQELDSKIL
jgi:hypothetical protein